MPPKRAQVQLRRWTARPGRCGRLRLHTRVLRRPSGAWTAVRLRRASVCAGCGDLGARDLAARSPRFEHVLWALHSGYNFHRKRIFSNVTFHLRLKIGKVLQKLTNLCKSCQHLKKETHSTEQFAECMVLQNLGTKHFEKAKRWNTNCQLLSSLAKNQHCFLVNFYKNRPNVSNLTLRKCRGWSDANLRTMYILSS